MTRATIRAGILGAMLLASAAPAYAAQAPGCGGATSGTSIPPPADAPRATPEQASVETPPIIRNALAGLRLFHLHQGRDGLDAAASARERKTDEAGE